MQSMMGKHYHERATTPASLLVLADLCLLSKTSPGRSRKRIKLMWLALPLYWPSYFVHSLAILVAGIAIMRWWELHKLPGVWHQSHCSSICCPSRCSWWNWRKSTEKAETRSHVTLNLFVSLKKKKKRGEQTSKVTMSQPPNNSLWIEPLYPPYSKPQNCLCKEVWQ